MKFKPGILFHHPPKGGQCIVHMRLYAVLPLGCGGTTASSGATAQWQFTHQLSVSYVHLTPQNKLSPNLARVPHLYFWSPFDHER